MSDRRITVVIMTRNRRDELLETLARMTALPERVPVIVADNASTDGTGEAAAERFGQVRLLRYARNLGAVARNLAVREVTTSYVAFCDDDARWRPGSLGRAADLLDAHPRLASVTARILVAPDLVEDPITFREVGGFSPRLWLGGEEELLALDLAARGWWMCWAHDVVVEHAPSKLREPRRRRRQLGICNTLWTAWLRRPIPGALRHTVSVVRSLPRDRARLGAIAEALGGLRWVLRERRVVPPEVELGLRLLEEPQRHSVARRYVG
jgi:glycosyltransferase involved in cell wall biosynthesis